jgi:hypothetical protein
MNFELLSAIEILFGTVHASLAPVMSPERAEGVST